MKKVEITQHDLEFRTDINLEVSNPEECESIGGIWDEEKVYATKTVIRMMKSQILLIQKKIDKDRM